MSSTALGKQHNPKMLALSDGFFYVALTLLGSVYVIAILALLLADVAYIVQADAQGSGWAEWFSRNNPLWTALAKDEIRYSIVLSLISCSLSAFFSIWVAIPLGYLLSRFNFPGKNLIDSILDIPIVLPPLVVGLSLLILFQFWPFIVPLGNLLPFSTPWDAATLNSVVVYQLPSVVIAQFMVAAAFAVRIMRATFEHINPRCEDVALTLGCSRAQAFGYVVLPESRRGILTAFTLAWARSLGEFGPLLIFAGATRNKTEVLSTTVFLELSIGDLEAAVSVSLIMVAAAVFVLVIARMWGSREMTL